MLNHCERPAEPENRARVWKNCLRLQLEAGVTVERQAVASACENFKEDDTATRLVLVLAILQVDSIADLDKGLLKSLVVGLEPQQVMETLLMVSQQIVTEENIAGHNLAMHTLLLEAKHVSVADGHAQQVLLKSWSLAQHLSEQSGATTIELAALSMAMFDLWQAAPAQSETLQRNTADFVRLLLKPNHALLLAMLEEQQTGALYGYLIRLTDSQCLQILSSVFEQRTKYEDSHLLKVLAIFRAVEERRADGGKLVHFIYMSLIDIALKGEHEVTPEVLEASLTCVSKPDDQAAKEILRVHFVNFIVPSKKEDEFRAYFNSASSPSPSPPSSPARGSHKYKQKLGKTKRPVDIADQYRQAAQQNKTVFEDSKNRYNSTSRHVVTVRESMAVASFDFKTRAVTHSRLQLGFGGAAQEEGSLLQKLRTPWTRLLGRIPRVVDLSEDLELATSCVGQETATQVLVMMSYALQSCHGSLEKYGNMLTYYSTLYETARTSAFYTNLKAANTCVNTFRPSGGGAPQTLESFKSVVTLAFTKIRSMSTLLFPRSGHYKVGATQEIIDFAKNLKGYVDGHYPKAFAALEVIVYVCVHIPFHSAR